MKRLIPFLGALLIAATASADFIGSGVRVLDGFTGEPVAGAYCSWVDPSYGFQEGLTDVTGFVLGDAGPTDAVPAIFSVCVQPPAGEVLYLPAGCRVEAMDQMYMPPLSPPSFYAVVDVYLVRMVDLGVVAAVAECNRDRKE